MGNPGCFPVGEELSLVEESAHGCNQRPDEKPTEHITRIMDAKFLLDELHKSRKRERELESQVKELNYARKQCGGRKMGGFGKFIAGAGVLAALYFGFDSYMARQENQDLRNQRYSAVERAEANNLMRELKKQVEGEEGKYNGANDCLELVKKVERNYAAFARDALKYIDNSVPKGELEDAVAEEVRGLRHFFESSQRENVAGRIDFCKKRYADAQRDDFSKSNLRIVVHYANQGYSETMGHYHDRSRTIEAWLPRFRRLVEHNPLKQRAQMLARIDIEMQSRKTVAEQTARYKQVFDSNNASYNIIPVEPVKQNQARAAK